MRGFRYCAYSENTCGSSDLNTWHRVTSCVPPHISSELCHATFILSSCVFSWHSSLYGVLIRVSKGKNIIQHLANTGQLLGTFYCSMIRESNTGQQALKGVEITGKTWFAPDMSRSH